MKLYGEELLQLGIIILISVLIMSVIFAVIFVIRSSRLKKQLETEYGPKDK